MKTDIEPLLYSSNTLPKYSFIFKYTLIMMLNKLHLNLDLKLTNVRKRTMWPK